VAAGALAPIALTSSASAVGETCNGLAATIVGTPGAKLTGTDGPDVVVTNGAAQIDAKGGNDTICTTNSAVPTSNVDPSVFVIAGAGDDFVDRRGDTDPALIGFGNLGPGRDTYYGAPGEDVVGLEDDLPDTISTYGGNDLAFTDDIDGPKKQPGTLDLGEGNDSFTSLDAISGALRVDGGPGVDSIEIGLHKRGSWKLDNRTGVLERKGRTELTMPGFEWVQVDGHPHQELVFRGNDGAERLHTIPVGLLKKANLGGGDDELVIEDNGHRGADHPIRVDGGAGTNTFDYDAHNPSRFVVDLRRHRFSTSEGVHGELRNVRDLVGTGGEVDLYGDGQANTITWTGCGGGVIRGRGGNDTITFQEFDGDSILCRHAPMTAYGDSGDDTITGGPDKDLLVGGSGTDTADGAGGHDTCRQVENAVSC
jgi:Ca2+-binding RTX toxin-like protein